jgi:hypothetical protein
VRPEADEMIHRDDLERWLRSLLLEIEGMDDDELAPEAYQAPDDSSPLGERRMTVGELREVTRAGLTRLTVERRMMSDGA